MRNGQAKAGGRRLTLWTRFVGWCILLLGAGPAQAEDLNDFFRQLSPAATVLQGSSPSKLVIRNPIAIPGAQAMLKDTPEAHQADSLVVISGGWGSCDSEYGARGTSVYYASKHYLKTLDERRETPSVIATCFYHLDKRIYASTRSANYIFSSVQKFADFVKRTVSQTRSEKIRIIGHSHGGWLSMMLASYLPIYIDTLVSLDPISKNYCQKTEMIAAMLAAPLTNNRPHPDCARSPREFKERHSMSIRNKTRAWLNFYQRHSPFLKSSSVRKVDRNYYLRYNFTNTPNKIFKAHVDIQSDRRAWDKIREFAF